ncbi:MAG: hypothetical protein L3J87_00645 [Thermoplasmata archaeon]|nr:hypothetical protein [Thermoplasmata archaeon]
MSLPGPLPAVWGIELLVFAGAVALLGEAIRGVGARHAALLRPESLWERALLDLYLGGGTFYVLAWVPGLFGPFTVPVFAAVAAAWLAITRLRAGRRIRFWERLRIALIRPENLVVLLVMLAVYAVELAVLGSVPSGNTWDASADATFGALLASHHALGLSLAPFASGFVSYPQGSIVWITSAQLLGMLPPARSAIFVTPLFLAIAPAGAYVVGRRWLPGSSAAVVFAVTVGVLGTWTRLLVDGSYDFVLAFPLVLLLVGWSRRWFEAGPLPWRDTVVFGAVAGYSAALNPVGVEWLLLSLPVAGVVLGARFGGSVRAWAARWAGAAATAVAFVVPSLLAIALSESSSGPSSFAAPPAHPASVGVVFAQFVGGIDPYLFRPQDDFLSPFPVLRIELAVLLTVAVLWPWVLKWRDALPVGFSSFGRWAAAAGVGAAVLVAASLAGAGGNPVAVFIASLSSAGEATVLLFTLYTLAAAVPLVVLVDRVAPPRPERADRAGLYPVGPSPASVPGRRGRSPSVIAALGLTIALLVPGIVAFPTAFPSDVRELAAPFGNLTAADFDLLTWAESSLPPGARVLVAPGGALEFLPAYAPSVAVLFPMIPGESSNASYRLLVAELSNGTLDASGQQALSVLAVGFIAVTQANTILWPPFQPGPLLADPTHFTVAFHEGDAYLFARA